MIIHELLHIKLWGMDQKLSFAYAQFMELLEVTTQDLTRGYVELGAGDKRVSYGRIQ